MNAFEAIKKFKLIAIIRNVPVELIQKTALALFEGGIRLMEVTFNQSSPRCEEDTVQSIRLIHETLNGKAWIGAGTVMTEKQAAAAISASAQFIISPNTDESVIRKTIELGALSIPGAFSPSEIVKAYQMGADFVKLFPADVLGVSYIKAVVSPVSHIPLLAVGGVNERNIQEYLKAGICGVGVGSNLVNNNLIQAGKFSELTDLARLFTDQLGERNE